MCLQRHNRATFAFTFILEIRSDRLEFLLYTATSYCCEQQSNIRYFRLSNEVKLDVVASVMESTACPLMDIVTYRDNRYPAPRD